MKEKNKGITLIALIITIIVMLILVGVTITVALNGGLFETATKAATETKKEALDTAGTYKYKLFTKKDELLYEKQFIVTDISGYTDNISYCGSNPTSSFLLTAKCSLSLPSIIGDA